MPWWSFDRFNNVSVTPHPIVKDTSFRRKIKVVKDFKKIAF